jgi:hypothetical protein
MARLGYSKLSEMIIFKNLEEVISYLGDVPRIRPLTVCHKNGIFCRGFGGKFIFYALYKGTCTKVFYRDSLYFQISCFMYKAVEPVEKELVDLLKKTINIDSSTEEDEVFCARPFRDCVSTPGRMGYFSSAGSFSVSV